MISRKWLLVIGGCLAVTATLATVKFLQIRNAIEFAKSFPEPREAVEFAYAEAVEWQPTLTVTGEVRAVQTLELSNELAGRIVELGFRSGERVSAGQLLVKLDTREEEADLAAAEAEAELARLALKRNQTLAKSGVASEEERDRALSQRKAAEATVERLQAVIDKKTLRAPFDAIAGIHELETGQFLQANTLITRLVGQNDSVWVDFHLPQQNATPQVGDLVAVTAPQLQERSVDGKIIARDPRVNSQSGNLRYRAVVQQANEQLLPGSLVTVTAATGAPGMAVRVPISAVRYDAFGPNIFVINPAEDGAQAPERAAKQSVKLGRESNEFVLVLSGIKAGAKVATNGSFKLRDGILVKSVPMRNLDTVPEGFSKEADASSTPTAAESPSPQADT